MAGVCCLPVPIGTTHRSPITVMECRPASSSQEHAHNKARSVGPGHLPAQPLCRPMGVGRSCAMVCVERAVIVFRSGDVQLWSELPALAPGARCRVGRSVESGAPGTAQWTACVPSRNGHARNISDPSRSVGAGAGSSARSCLLLRGGVFHQWSLRIPLQPRWDHPRVPATAAAASTPLFTAGNGAS